MSNKTIVMGLPAVVAVVPVIDYAVRALCANPYPLHPKGCPNLGSCERCPPTAGLFDRLYDLSRPVYAVVNEYDLGAHVDKLRLLHPGWSERQLYCVLYWQPTARKQLALLTRQALSHPRLSGYVSERCPEGTGVDVTATLADAGIVLEWPARTIARQVVFLAVPRLV